MATPGPWAVSPTKHRTLIVSAHGFHVAAIEDVSPEDAAIIAAAPAMLECLLSLTTTLPVDNFGRRSYKAAYESMIRQARAAIAAATKD